MFCAWNGSFGSIKKGIAILISDRKGDAARVNALLCIIFITEMCLMQRSDNKIMHSKVFLVRHPLFQVSHFSLECV